MALPDRPGKSDDTEALQMRESSAPVSSSGFFDKNRETGLSPEEQKNLLLTRIEKEISQRRHDVNNLLTIILGSAEVVRTCVTGNNGNQQDIEKIIAECSAAARRIQEILKQPLAAIARARHNVELTIEPVEIIKILQQIQEIFAETNIFINDESPSPVVEGDTVYIFRLLYNIIQNAIKFSENPSLPVIITLRNADNKHLEIEIRDFGPGISEDPENLFKNGHRSEKTIHLPGTGTGLSLCREICTYHKGTVTARNNNYDNLPGAVFTVTLPYNQDKNTLPPK